jgi:tRNA (mo5U34)-methyltransferase
MKIDAKVLKDIKAAHPEIRWYPYSDLDVYLWQIRDVMGEAYGELVKAGRRVFDVGSADGDLAFFLEGEGCLVTALDYPNTNFNACQGIKTMHRALGSKIELLFQDIDFGLKLNDKQFDLTFACGILYHLRNPLYLLIELAQHSEYLVASTRVANRLPCGTDISGSPVAYLLAHDESLNKDPTNYWIFSPAGLRRALTRCGWIILNERTHGAAEGDPVYNDQRMFMFCRRIEKWKDLRKHYNF